MLGPCTPWETRISTWLLPSDQRGAPAAARRPGRPLEGEPMAKEDLSLCLSLSLSTLPVKKKKKLALFLAIYLLIEVLRGGKEIVVIGM